MKRRHSCRARAITLPHQPLRWAIAATALLAGVMICTRAEALTTRGVVLTQICASDMVTGLATAEARPREHGAACSKDGKLTISGEWDCNPTPTRGRCSALGKLSCTRPYTCVEPRRAVVEKQAQDDAEERARISALARTGMFKRPKRGRSGWKSGNDRARARVRSRGAGGRGAVRRPGAASGSKQKARAGGRVSTTRAGRAMTQEEGKAFMRDMKEIGKCKNKSARKMADGTWRCL